MWGIREMSVCCASFYSLLFAWGVILMFLGIWALRVQPKKEIAKKYPKWVIFLSTVPFSRSWRKHVENEDLPVLESYRQRIGIWYLCFFVPVLCLNLVLLIDLIYWKTRTGFP
jgi:hypothetical protein